MSKTNSQASEQETQEQQLIDPAVPEQFCVHGDGSANWVIRQIVERRAYARHCAKWCEREQRRAQHDEQFLLLRYGQQLMDYARHRLAEQGNRRKSVALPAGTIGFRHEAAKIIVDDEGAVIAWAREHQPELVAVIEHLSKSGLNQYIERTGELPDAGIHVEPARDAFYVR